MPAHLTLPSRLDSSSTPDLLACLRPQIGQPLVLDASGVEVIGALAIEVLVAAGRQWLSDGLTLQVVTPSPAFVATCATLGLCPTAPWRLAEEAAA